MLPPDILKLIKSFVPVDKLSEGRCNKVIKPEIDIYNSLKNIWNMTFIEFSLKHNSYSKFVFRYLFGMSSLTPEQLDLLADLSPTSSYDLDFLDASESSTSSDF